LWKSYSITCTKQLFGGVFAPIGIWVLHPSPTDELALEWKYRVFIGSEEENTWLCIASYVDLVGTHNEGGGGGGNHGTYKTAGDAEWKEKGLPVETMKQRKPKRKNKVMQPRR
jgi:hypothetical protein